MCEGGRDPRRGRGQRRGCEAAACGGRGRLSPGSSAHGEAAARWELWQERGRSAEEGGVAAGDGAMASRGVVLCVCLMSVY